MAFTIASVSNADYVSGNKKVKVRTLTFDSSYATGGESLTPSEVGLKVITECKPHGPFRTSSGSTAISVSYDYTNSKMFAYRTKDPGNAGGADVPLQEVANTTDLSTFSGRVTFVGY